MMYNNSNIYITPCTCRLWLAPGPLACINTKVCVVCSNLPTNSPPSPTKNACMKLYGCGGMLSSLRSIFIMCRKRFTDKDNQEVVKRLCNEMKTLDPSVSPSHVRGKLVAF